MARAHSIFILRNIYHRNIIGAWTVKQELIDWLQHQNRKKFVIHYEVLRLRDGQADHETVIPWEKIL